MNLRRKTAAEKAQKDEKKNLKEDKKDVKKDAREERKEIRQSNLSKDEKKDAIKANKDDKRVQVEAIKKDLKKVRKNLEIALPDKTANVALLRNDLHDIEFNDGRELRGISIEDAYALINEAYDKSIVLAESGLAYIKPFVELSERPSWVTNWNNDALLVQWFGRIDNVLNATDVFNRLNSVVERLNKKITIRLLPQRDYTTSAQNSGSFFDPKTFVIFPLLFKNSLTNTTLEFNPDIMASVMIHELIHTWFTDQKLDGEKVYGIQLAQDLAINDPKKARRSAENYEKFCLSFA